MILSIHAITGAVLASNSDNFGQIVVLGVASHYFLDSIPHVEYKIENIKNGNLKMAAKEFSKILFDLLLGLVVILFIIQDQSFNQSIFILTGSFFALLPDGLYFIDCLIKNKDRNIFTKFLKNHTVFHKKTHSVVSKKTITIPSQIVIILILIYLIL